MDRLLLLAGRALPGLLLLLGSTADALPVLSISVDRAIATEGTLFPVRIDLALDAPAPPGGVCVDIDLAGGSARPGEDFQVPLSVPRIPEGGLFASIPVMIVDDDRSEPDETLLIVLRPSACFQPGASHEFSLLIRDDDDDPGSLGDRLQGLVGAAPDPLVASQLANLGQLCATNQPPPGSELDRRCQLFRLALRDPAAAQQLVQSLRGVLGEEFSSQRRGFRTLVGSQLGGIGRRLEALRSGAGSGLALVDSGLQTATGFLPLAASLADDGDLFASGLGVFASVNFGNGERATTDLESGYENDSTSILIGIDRRLGPGWIVGAAYGRASFDADMAADSGELDLLNDSLTFYASRAFERGWIDATLAYGRGELTQTRIARFGGSTDEGSFSSVDVLRGTPDSRMLGAGLSSGWDWRRGSFSIGPRVAIEYSRFEVDAFAEELVSGSDAFALQLEEQRIRSLIARLGFGSQWAISTRFGVILPQFEASWVAQFEDESGVVRGSFANDPQHRPFELPTAAVDARYGEALVAVAMQFSDGFSGYLSYRRLFDFEATEQDYWSVGFRVEL